MEDQDIMFCAYCTTAGVSAIKTHFIKGCTSLRLESLKYHEASKTHVLATNAQVNKVNSSDAPVLKVKFSLKKVNSSKASEALQNCSCYQCEGKA